MFLNVYAYAYDQLMHFAARLTHAGIGGLKMREWKMRQQTAGMENVGVIPIDSQPENKFRWR